MNKNPSLRTYAQIEPYLTPRAQEVIQALQDLGVEDRDLAITMAEKILPEAEMYELEPEQA